jgi:tetratricopeptide (TPR) repeat protein
MAKCRYCGSKGWLNAVDNNGLCRECQQIYLPDIVNRCRIVLESNKIIEKSKNIDTILSRVDVAIENLEVLKQYHDRGVPTFSAPPQDLIIEFEADQAAAINRFIHEQFVMARAAIESSSTPAGKMGGYKKAIERLNKLLTQTRDVSQIEEAISQMVSERDTLRTNLAVNKAEALVAKGRVKQAIDALIDAKTDLIQDTTPDEEQKRLFTKIDLMLNKLSDDSR